MEKEDYNQLELFSQAKISRQTTPKISHTFSNLIWTYEKAILIIFALIITGILSFSFGVERGKKIIMLKSNSRLDVALKRKESTPVPPVSHQAIDKEVNQGVTKKIVKIQPTLSTKELPGQAVTKYEVKERTQNFTIQIASYRTKTYAQKEAERLKKRGYSPVVLSKGSFSIVCVGNFPKQELAKSLLTELKKFYQDSYIRRL